MNPKIGVIYTSFLRDELMKRTLQSIVNNWHEDFVVLIGDQRDSVPPLFNTAITEMRKKGLINYFMLPFDCGLSRSRNFLVEQAAKFGLEYCLITADSIEFTPETIERMDDVKQYLKNSQTGILGFNIKNKVSWEYFMDLKEGKFILTNNFNDYLDLQTRLVLKDCDICRNFFLAKTEILLKVQWDNELKLCEHEDFFWRIKQAGYKVKWTPNVSGSYIDFKPPNYLEYRMRIYKEFMKLLQMKYKLNGWVEYQ